MKKHKETVEKPLIETDNENGDVSAKERENVAAYLTRGYFLAVVGLMFALWVCALVDHIMTGNPNAVTVAAVWFISVFSKKNVTERFRRIGIGAGERKTEVYFSSLV